jgi:nucleotide-binding universal stress UspA family protein
MFDTILVPLDGSQLADCVLPHVSAIAHPFDAEVTLLHMLETNRTGISIQSFDLVNWQINRTKANLYLEKTKTYFQESNIRTHITVLEGLVADGITEYARNQGIKLIVLSSHGRNGLNDLGVSSITQKIILSTHSSLLLIRAHQHATQTDEPSNTVTYQRILVALDGSQRAEIVLPIITQLAHFHKSQIHLVQVVETPEMARQMPPTREDLELSRNVVARNQTEAKKYLDQIRSRSHLEGVFVKTHLITSDNALVALHQLVEQERIDLVILSAHGYSGNRQWPYGSTVYNFIMYGKTSLLIVQDLPISIDQQSAEHVER